MRIAVCDDNAAFLDKLLREIAHWSALADMNNQYIRFQSGLTLQESDLSAVQVLFLDIEMPNCNGLDVARKIRSKYPDLLIVFVTNWIEYAPSGYQINAFRYLLKNRLSEELPHCMNDLCQKISENCRSVFIPTRDRDLSVLVKDILFFEGTPNRCVLMHCNGSADNPVVCTGKLSDYEARFREHGFLRIQKSYLVNMSHIVRIRNQYAYLQNGKTLKVSEKNYSEICRTYLIWRGQTL